MEPILRAFESCFAQDSASALEQAASPSSSSLESGDAIYFLLSLACSSNIGSALTYTGNPQNMIVSLDALSVMSPGLFLAYQLLPSVFSWLITTLFVQYCWRKDKARSYKRVVSSTGECGETLMVQSYDKAVLPAIDSKVRSRSRSKSSRHSKSIRESIIEEEPLSPALESPPRFVPPSSPVSPLSPRQRRLRDNMLNKVSYVVFSPLPMLAIVIVLAMIALIFLNIVSIAALVCMTAVALVVILVVGNHWKGQTVWVREDGAEVPTSREEMYDSLADFFEELFQSIDYSLLLIFLGTFVVVGNLDSTGIPARIWSKIVGESPFNTIRSVIGISIFVLVSSQLLGNVAVVQMARPNVEPLGDTEKKYAWAVIR